MVWNMHTGTGNSTGVCVLPHLLEIKFFKNKNGTSQHILTHVELGKCSQTRRLTDNFATRDAQK
jgi:hypothetical protein